MNVASPSSSATSASQVARSRLVSSRGSPQPPSSALISGLATFMHAAGITCSQRLGDLLADLEPAGEADAVRLLGAALRP